MNNRPELTATGMVTVTFAVLGLLSASSLYLASAAENVPITVVHAMLIGCASWMVWALFAPGILWLGRRFDFRGGHRATSVAVHVAALVACHVPSSLFATWLGLTVFAPDRPPTAAVLWRSVVMSTRLPLSVLSYAAILGLGYALRIMGTLRERDLQASRLEVQAAQARLEALATRLQPHFLFNTLHTVGGLIAEDPWLARAVLVQLGDLLRDVLADPGGVEVPLREELALLRRYLDIEQLRFADRLHVNIAMPAALSDIRVPRLLLQPLVENALRHGLAPRAAGGILTIEATATAGKLRLRVWNNGVPLADSYQQRIGLATTCERLATLHGAAATLVLRSATGGGVEAVVELPAVAAVA